MESGSWIRVGRRAARIVMGPGFVMQVQAQEQKNATGKGGVCRGSFRFLSFSLTWLCNQSSVLRTLLLCLSYGHVYKEWGGRGDDKVYDTHVRGRSRDGTKRSGSEPCLLPF